MVEVCYMRSCLLPYLERQGITPTLPSHSHLLGSHSHMTIPMCIYRAAASPLRARGKDSEWQLLKLDPGVLDPFSMLRSDMVLLAPLLLELCLLPVVVSFPLACNASQGTW